MVMRQGDLEYQHCSLKIKPFLLQNGVNGFLPFSLVSCVSKNTVPESHKMHALFLGPVSGFCFNRRIVLSGLRINNFMDRICLLCIEQPIIASCSKCSGETTTACCLCFYFFCIFHFSFILKCVGCREHLSQTLMFIFIQIGSCVSSLK